MSKIWNIIKPILVILFVLLILFALFVIWFIWFGFYDITGLTLYNDEPIAEIIPCDDRLYFITEDGKGYITGGYDLGSTRTYLNSEFHRNEKLGISSPVKFTDEQIKQLFPFEYGALFITDNNDLYKAIDERSEYIFDDAIYADYAILDSDSLIYAINTSNELYSINGQRGKVFLCNDVKAVKACRDRIFVLRTNGDLCELIKTDSEEYEFSEPLFGNVVDFDVTDTSTRYDGEKFIYDDEKAINTPLFNVLTESGDLYVKGCYSLLKCMISISAHPDPFEFDEWTLVSENVKSFDLAPMGTIFIRNDTSCAYYGFDTKTGSNINYKVDYKELIEEGAISAHTADDVCVYVKTSDNKYYIWGNWSRLLFDQNPKNDHNIFTGEPFILEP